LLHVLIAIAAGNGFGFSALDLKEIGIWLVDVLVGAGTFAINGVAQGSGKIGAADIFVWFLGVVHNFDKKAFVDTSNEDW
jgi:hypothetical protein